MKNNTLLVLGVAGFGLYAVPVQSHSLVGFCTLHEASSVCEDFDSRGRNGVDWIPSRFLYDTKNMEESIVPHKLGYKDLHFSEDAAPKRRLGHRAGWVDRDVPDSERHLTFQNEGADFVDYWHRHERMFNDHLPHPAKGHSRKHSRKYKHGKNKPDFDTHSHKSKKFKSKKFKSNKSKKMKGANPAVVPVPAAIWLFGTGLIGLAVTLRKRQS
jgi:hypothetical protein